MCKQKIEFEFMKHMRALAEESVYPFENVNFETQCKNISAAHPPVVRLSNAALLRSTFTTRNMVATPFFFNYSCGATKTHEKGV